MPLETLKFSYENHQPKAVDLIIEPWAQVEVVPSGGIVIFEVNAAPIPEIEFSTTDEGDPFVYVMSEHVRIYINGVLKYDFETDIRPPGSSFHFVNSLVFSKVVETQVKPKKIKTPFWQFWK